MPKVQRVGDQNEAGGIILNGDNTVLVNGRPIALRDAPVSPHRPCKKPPSHCNARTQAVNNTVLVNGKPIVLSNDTDTCGHKRSGGSPDVIIG